MTITDAGRGLLAESDRVLDRVEEDTFSVLNEKERGELIRLSTILFTQ
ncbi:MULTISPECIES: hypothetical protein [unclassified Rhodococcus (in: high G+C Gram-positive bacteria)]|nr:MULTISPECIES: hypothetical protein [unclassified Rhodococcus (in: high G+C Gram-positive bacteria)]MDJ0359628.1 hypothetical protein [Rhodococcus sp. H29-C3]